MDITLEKSDIFMLEDEILVQVKLYESAKRYLKKFQYKVEV